MLGNILVQGYGLTESTSFTTCMRAQDYEVEDPSLLDRRLTAVGRAVPTLEVRVVDDRGNDVAPDGEAVGEIITRGPSIMQGYWKQPEATAEVLRDGWLYTGDLGTIDDDGFIWMVGRKKDVINSGGLKIYPEEVEGVLYTMPQIKEVAVIGRPDERYGEAVTAIVVIKPGENLTGEEIAVYTKERIASYKKPTLVVFTDALPRNPSGKVKKHELREMLAKGKLK